jgi:hypothetical protein
LGANITLKGLNSASAPLVQVENYGALVMKAGAKIIDNKRGSGSSVYGGGVYIGSYSSFTMTGGEISGNTARDGGGVYIGVNSSFTMTGGEIHHNTATGNGGGVYSSTWYAYPFRMSNGEIRDNTAASGGGVYLYDIGLGGTAPNFEMSGGEIKGNTASGGTGGGGVYFSAGSPFNSMFTKTGGAIYGGTELPGIKNTAASGEGHAVLLSDGRKRNSTAGTGVYMSSTYPGASGGWEQ